MIKNKIAAAAGLIVALVAIPVSSNAAAPANVAALSSTLSSMRAQCSQMAFNALNQQQRALTLSNAHAQGALMLSDGSEQSMNEMMSAERSRNTQINAKAAADSEKIEKCVHDAVVKGEALYKGFKTSHVNKQERALAVTLMSAWLTNVKEISLDQYRGGGDSYSAWKAAEARAEVSSL